MDDNARPLHDAYRIDATSAVMYTHGQKQRISSLYSESLVKSS